MIVISATYPDLLSDFPEAVDKRFVFQSPTISAMPLITEYKRLKSIGDDAGATAYLELHPELKSMMTLPEIMQLQIDSNIATQRTLNDGLDTYVIKANKYLNDWNDHTKYIIMDIVNYDVDGDGVKQSFQNLYNGVTPIGTPPTNTKYWIPKTIRGAKGDKGDSDLSLITAHNINTEAHSDIRTAINEKTDYGVVNGLAVTAQSTPNMTVNIVSGVAYTNDGKRYAPSSATLTVPTADSTLARQDVVYINNGGGVVYSAETITKIAGSRSYNFPYVGAIGDTLTICGVTLTATASTTDSTHYAKGDMPDTTIANICTALLANTTFTNIYNAIDDHSVIVVTEKNAGGGNTPSIATYTGSIQPEFFNAITSSVSSTPASLPTDGFLLAQINVPAGAGAIGNGMIIDKRKFISVGATPASKSTITDTGNNYTSDNVEGALAEVAARISANENSRTLSLVDAVPPEPLVGHTKTISGYNTLSMPNNAKSVVDYVVKGNTDANGLSVRDCRIRNCGKNLLNINGDINCNPYSSATDTNLKIDNGIRVFTDTVHQHGKGIFINVVPNTTYVISGNILLGGGSTKLYSTIHDGYDLSDILLLSYSSTFSATFTSKSNKIFIELARLGGDTGMTSWVDFTNIQIELGSATTAYEPYRESKMYIKTGYPHKNLPNLVCDTIDSNEADTQNINDPPYRLKTSDIVSMNTTNTMLDYAVVKKPANYSNYGKFGTKSFKLNGYPEFYDTADSAIHIGQVSSWCQDTCFWVGFTKGTTLATAQTALTGTILTYQLTTPIITQAQIVGNMQVYPNGTTYVEPCIFGFTTTATTTITTADYPESAIKSVIRYDIINGKLVKTDVTANCTFTATTLTIANFVSGKTYFYDCDVSSSLSAPANLVMNVEVDNGVISHDFGASVGAWTLTSNESKATMLTCTNAGGVANIIIPATDGKMYVIKNTCGYTLTVKTRTSTGITIATAKTATIIYTGTDFMKLSEI